MMIIVFQIMAKRHTNYNFLLLFHTNKYVFYNLNPVYNRFIFFIQPDYIMQSLSAS